MPIAAKEMLNSNTNGTDWRSMRRAASKSLAPTLWATCTEKPVAAALSNPQNSHVVVETRPMEAEASAPRLPTIEASIYCMAMADR